MWQRLVLPSVCAMGFAGLTWNHQKLTKQISELQIKLNDTNKEIQKQQQITYNQSILCNSNKNEENNISENISNAAKNKNNTINDSLLNQNMPKKMNAIEFPIANNFSSIINDVSDSIVNIEIEIEQKIPIFWGHIATIPNRGLGSGVIIGTDGIIVTNNHVVSFGDSEYQIYHSHGHRNKYHKNKHQKPQIKVTFNDGTQYNAHIVLKDPLNDLALLKIENTNTNSKNQKNNTQIRKFKALPIGNPVKCKVGDPVIAIGNMFGLQNTVTDGIGLFVLFFFCLGLCFVFIYCCIKTERLQKKKNVWEKKSVSNRQSTCIVHQSKRTVF